MKLNSNFKVTDSLKNTYYVAMGNYREFAENSLKFWKETSQDEEAAERIAYWEETINNIDFLIYNSIDYREE